MSKRIRTLGLVYLVLIVASVFRVYINYRDVSVPTWLIGSLIVNFILSVFFIVYGIRSFIRRSFFTLLIILVAVSLLYSFFFISALISLFSLF